MSEQKETDWVKVASVLTFECAACGQRKEEEPVINKESGEVICQTCALRVPVSEDTKVEGRP